MLPAAARLAHRRDFQRAVRQGTRAGRPSLAVHVARAAEPAVAQPPQVGFIVSQAVGGAVVRNRVRRQLRHVARSRIDQLTTAVPGGLIVVRAAPAAAGAPSSQLAADFDAAVSSAVSSRRSQHSRAGQRT